MIRRLFQFILLLILVAACKNKENSALNDSRPGTSSKTPSSMTRTELQQAIEINKAELAVLQSELAKKDGEQTSSSSNSVGQGSTKFVCQHKCKTRDNDELMQCAGIADLVAGDDTVHACVAFEAGKGDSGMYIYSEVTATSKDTALPECKLLDGIDCSGFPALAPVGKRGVWKSEAYEEYGNKNSYASIAAAADRRFQINPSYNPVKKFTVFYYDNIDGSTPAAASMYGVRTSGRVRD